MIRYIDFIKTMIYKDMMGFNEIAKKSDTTKKEIEDFILETKCSIATAYVFAGFLNMKYKDNSPISLREIMLAALVCVANCYGLDTDKTSDLFTNKDERDLIIVTKSKIK